MMRIFLYVAAFLVIIGIATSMYLFSPRGATITNFEECQAAGNPIMESYPRQCRSADGLIFVEQINANGTSTAE